jgi:hypothetical protein
MNIPFTSEADAIALVTFLIKARVRFSVRMSPNDEIIVIAPGVGPTGLDLIMSHLRKTRKQ